MPSAAKYCGRGGRPKARTQLSPAELSTPSTTVSSFSPGCRSPPASLWPWGSPREAAAPGTPQKPPMELEPSQAMARAVRKQLPVSWLSRWPNVTGESRVSQDGLVLCFSICLHPSGGICDVSRQWCLVGWFPALLVNQNHRCSPFLETRWKPTGHLRFSHQNLSQSGIC